MGERERVDLTFDEKFQLVRGVADDGVTDDELTILLEDKINPICYHIVEPSDKMDIAQVIMESIIVTKLVKAGCIVKVWLADWLSLLNDKTDGDLKKVRTMGCYFIEVWNALGMNDKVDFVWASEEINKQGNEYWPLVIDISRRNSLQRIMSCGQIVETEEEISSAHILYRFMQCADIFLSEADIYQMGMDRCEVKELAIDYCISIGRDNLPIILSHRILSVLDHGQVKMSKSDLLSSIFMIEVEDGVNTEIKKAYCPLGTVDRNPCMEYIKHITFPWFGNVEVVRNERSGGNMTFTSMDEMFVEYTYGRLSPRDIKDTLSKALNKILQPVRDHFNNNPEAKDLLRTLKLWSMFGERDPLEGVRMGYYFTPDQCSSCKKKIGDKWVKYVDLLLANYRERDALDGAGLVEICCRETIILHADRKMKDLVEFADSP